MLIILAPLVAAPVQPPPPFQRYLTFPTVRLDTGDGLPLGEGSPISGWASDPPSQPPALQPDPGEQPEADLATAPSRVMLRLGGTDHLAVAAPAMTDVLIIALADGARTIVARDTTASTTKAAYELAIIEDLL